MRDNFISIANDTMILLGYYSPNQTKWKPEYYGRWWCEHDSGSDWYEWMFNTRRKMHEDFIEWINVRDHANDKIESIADFGCGIGYGYSDLLADRRYVGIDLDQRNIEWCRKNRSNKNHQYLGLDFINDRLPERYDVVMSSGTIDNTYDVDAFIVSMIAASNKWIYITCYRGWFPDLSEHRYTWSNQHQCFYTDISPNRIFKTLTNMGCKEIIIEPVPTLRLDIRYETRIIARITDHSS